MAVVVGKTDSQIAALAPVQSVAGMTGDVTLTTSDISGLDTTLSEKADLVGGYVPSSQIPAIAITEYLGAVVDEPAMLALDGDQGDWCIRTDSSTAWVLSADDSTLLGSWIQIPHPQSPVLSVNGQTGVIDLVSSDIGAQAASGTLTATIATTTPTNLTGLLVGNGTDVDALDSTTNGHVLRVASGVKGWGTLDATSIGAGGVDNTEYGYLNGVTSSIQTQLDGKQASNADLLGIATLNTDGIPARTAAGTYAARTLTGTTNIITVTNGNGVLGDPTFNVGSLVMRSNTFCRRTQQQPFGAVTLTDGASISWNCSSQESAFVTLAGNRTLANPSNMVDGGTYQLRVKQDATGGRTLAYGSAYDWGVDGPPTLSTGANKIDILTFTSDGTKMYGAYKKGFG